ncbi:MAG: hypothetical protein ACU0GG_08280 [Paracoccaceae bacterium]
MNDWGVPDWKKPDAIQSHDWCETRWYWEFLRRRDDLREDFDAKAQAWYQREAEQHRRAPNIFPAPLQIDEPGFRVSTELIWEGKVEWLPNPRIGNQPFYNGWFRNHPEQLTAFAVLSPPEDRHRIDFNLSAPIEPQLKRAAETLKTHQKERSGRLLQRRRHVSKWVTYLRVLDARADGASWSEIAEILEHTEQKPQTARDTFNNARALCFNFFG